MRHYSNAWKFLLIFENLKLRPSELYHFAYATASPFQIFQIVIRGKKKDFRFLWVLFGEWNLCQAVKPSDCLYFVSICPRGSESLDTFSVELMSCLCFYTHSHGLLSFILTHFSLILYLCVFNFTFTFVSSFEK